MDIKPIRTEAEYDAALKEIERLWGSTYGTPQGDKLDVLVTLVEAYEEQHHPVPPPDHETYVREAIENGLADSLEGRKTSVEEVRAEFGLSE